MSEEVKLRFCQHCDTKQPADTFKPVRERGVGRICTYKCAKCWDFMTLPQSERDRRGAIKAKEQRGAKARRQQELAKNRREQALKRQREGKL